MMVSGPVVGCMAIAIQPTTGPDTIIAKEEIAMDFYPGKEGTHRTIVIIGTGNFAAVTARTASSLGHQNPFRRIDKPNSPTIDIFLLTTKKG